MTDLVNTETTKPTFQLVEGSNYKIIDSYKVEYVVDFAQFKRIAHAIFKTEADAVTINDEILFRRFIYKIMPTKDGTPSETEAANARKVAEKLKYEQNTVVADRWFGFCADWMDIRFGKGKWSSSDKIKNLKNIKQDYDKRAD